MFSLTLRGKYIIGTTLILLIIVGVFSWQTIKMQEKQISDDDRERVVLITEIIRNGLITIMLEGRGREFQKFLEALIARDIEDVRIFRTDGIIISSTLPSEIGKKIYPEDLDRFTTQTEPGVFTHLRQGKTFYSMVVPIYNEPACQKCHGKDHAIRGVLDVEVSRERTIERLSSFRKRLIIFSLFTMAILFIALSLLTKYLINKPIDGIIETMKEVEEGDLHARFITQRRDEIGKLSSSLGSMLTQLQTAQKQIETYHREELQRVEKMATIGELASAIAHEIKNPLAGISGAIQVFAEDFPENDPRREVICDVIKEIDRLDKAVRDLLNFAKPPVPHPLLTDVHSLMERLINVISSQTSKQGVRVALNMSDKKIRVCLDPEQFQQVFLNIALNAVQAMPSGGVLDIAVHENDHHVEFAFKDTGVGILDQDMKNLFKPFFTTKHSGSGLGLAISKTIVEQHGGHIAVMSRPGAGSTFTITIPHRDCEHEQI